MYYSIHIRTVFHNLKVHSVLDCGLALPLDAVSVCVEHHHILLGNGIVRHGGGCQIYVPGFRVAQAEIAPCFHRKPGFEHPFAGIYKKLLVIHK